MNKIINTILLLLVVFAAPVALAISIDLTVDNQSSLDCQGILMDRGLIFTDARNYQISNKTAVTMNFVSGYITNLFINGDITCSEIDNLKFKLQSDRSNLKYESGGVAAHVHFADPVITPVGDDNSKFTVTITILDNNPKVHPKKRNH